jgi:hypothetical protein
MNFKQSPSAALDAHCGCPAQHRAEQLDITLYRARSHLARETFSAVAPGGRNPTGTSPNGVRRHVVRCKRSYVAVVAEVRQQNESACLVIPPGQRCVVQPGRTLSAKASPQLAQGQCILLARLAFSQQRGKQLFGESLGGVAIRST